MSLQAYDKNGALKINTSSTAGVYEIISDAEPTGPQS